MNISRIRMDWRAIGSWLRQLWQNRSARYVTLLIVAIGLIGNQLPFEPYDWAQKSITASLNAKPYRGDAVVVEINSRTVTELGRPRLTDLDLAKLIKEIASAKPKQIVIGRISQRVSGHVGSPEVAAAIKRISPKPIMFVAMLPKRLREFSQDSLVAKNTGDLLSAPKIEPALVGLVVPANDIFSNTPFGAPWGLPPTILNNGVLYPSISQLMAEQREPIYEKYEIDFSYHPDSIPTVNAIEILKRNYDRQNIFGKKIFISASLDNSQDAIQTPHGQFSSPASISIFGAQTLIDGPPLMIGWIPSFIIAVLGISAWMNLRPRYGRTAVIITFLSIFLSPILLERHSIFQHTSNAVFLMTFVAIGRQWNKFRATLALARSAAETKSWFLAQASHDLRQPIHAIGMLSARLSQTNLTKDQAALASKIERSIEGANRMLQSLLDLATIESGSLEPKIGPIAVNALFSEIEEQNSLMAERAGVDLRFVPSEAIILADRSLTTAMLQNIVSNAIKYATGKKILIGARRSGGNLSLCVYDVGAGISNDDMRHVRTAFFRASSHKKGGVEGTGLGLAIVHRLAKLLGLKFVLRSTPGKGTAAIINGFKLTDASATNAAALQSNMMRPLNGVRVLLTDDDVDSLRATEALLEQWGCIVSAYDAFPDTHESVDIILSDFDFGRGHTLADHRTKIDALARDGVSTIVLSGHHPDTVKSAMKRDSLLVLAKPVRPAELRSVLMANRPSVGAR